MSDTFTTWKGPESIQWGCALMELLGESSLDLLPLLLSGSHAAESSAQARAHVTAIQNTRRRTGKLLTRRAVQVAVKSLNSKVKTGEVDATYRINPDTLTFTAAPGHGAVIREAQAILQTPHAYAAHGLTLAPSGDMVARLRPYSAPLNVPVRLTGLTLPPPAQHELTRRPCADLTVTLDGLRATARRLDDLDENAPWKAEAWLDRLENVIHLQRTTPAGLETTETLDLRGLRHLIGLPGAGKTTLISLLCAHLAEQGKRVAVFFTSIETAREYLDRLRRYGMSTAMLVGRSETTHRRHGERLAELIATQGNGGFGHTLPGADLFAQTCPLPAYAVNARDAWSGWEATDAPCEQIHDPATGKRHLCPLWSRCGRVKNQRDLVHANVWLGHVRSADTPVPAHTSPERLQYFELIAQTFDLVIFDEVDETQKTLDELGSKDLDLGGNPESIHAQAQKVTRLAFDGKFPVNDRRMYNHSYAANNFERQLIRLHEEISLFERDHQTDLSLALENRLLTTNFLIRQALKHFEIELDSAHRSVIYAFWDSAMYAAYNPDRPPPPPQVDEALGLSPEQLRERWTALVDSLKRYWHQVPRADDFDEEMEVLTEHFSQLLSPQHHKRLAPVARLTVTVGFAIAAYQELVRRTRPLANHDILPQAVRSDASRALELFVARNMLGTFSSVRYRRKFTGSGFDIDYLVLDTVPRLLLHRLHHQGANVLLTSATSWMPDATAYHVGVHPDYVLRPKKQADTRLRLHFRPVQLPGKPPLRVSGAGRYFTANLKQVVRHLAKPAVGGGPSELQRTAQSLRTPQGRIRQCALVVNSYEQVVQVVREIAQVNPGLAVRTRGVVKVPPEVPGPVERYVLRGQVETLGHQEEVTVIVFPMTALGRGVNIVFHTDDDDNGSAAIGALYFLIRPHPLVGDLTLMRSGIARATEEFDVQDYADTDLHGVQEAQSEARKKLYNRTMRLLARPMSASMLPDEQLRPFSANLLIPILQTIGRAIRRSRPAEVYFVDAAWAPDSARDRQDTERSSVLVGMQKLLQEYVHHPDPAERAIFEALYKPFADAFDDIENLGPGGIFAPEDDEDDIYSTALLEDADEEDE